MKKLLRRIKVAAEVLTCRDVAMLDGAYKMTSDTHADLVGPLDFSYIKPLCGDVYGFFKLTEVKEDK